MKRRRADRDRPKTFLVVVDPCRNCHPNGPVGVYVAKGTDRDRVDLFDAGIPFDRNQTIVTLTFEEATDLAGRIRDAIREHGRKP